VKGGGSITKAKGQLRGEKTPSRKRYSARGLYTAIGKVRKAEPIAKGGVAPSREKKEGKSHQELEKKERGNVLSLPRDWGGNSTLRGCFTGNHLARGAQYKNEDMSKGTKKKRCMKSKLRKL